MKANEIDTSQVVIVRDAKVEKAVLISTHVDNDDGFWCVVAVLSDGKFQVVPYNEVRLAASVLPGPKPE